MFCLTASVTSASRMMFAFSRDRAVPGHKLWRKVAPNRVPVAAVCAIGVLAWALMIPTYWNAATGYLVGTSIAVIGLYIAFILPVILRFRMGDRFVPGAWTLGKHYKWIDWIAKDERQRRMIIVRPNRPGALEARLTYLRMKELPGATLLEIRLETGRKHQIRVQFASRGHPIVGDRKYDSRRRFADGIALHCRKVVIEHPVKKTPLELVAPFPAAWRWPLVVASIADVVLARCNAGEHRSSWYWRSSGPSAWRCTRRRYGPNRLYRTVKRPLCTSRSREIENLPGGR
jgi:hypothetical protein